MVKFVYGKKRKGGDKNVDDMWMYILYSFFIFF